MIRAYVHHLPQIYYTKLLCRNIKSKACVAITYYSTRRSSDKSMNSWVTILKYSHFPIRSRGLDRTRDSGEKWDKLGDKSRLLQ